MKKLNVCVTAGAGYSTTSESIAEERAFSAVLDCVMGNSVPLSGCSLLLDSVEYDKKVYSHGWADLSFSVSDMKQSANRLPQILKSAFLDEECLVDIFGFNCELNEMSEENRAFIAKNYYVQNVDINNCDSHFVCTLKCCSYDYHLSVKKGSEVFVGKKFGADIFTSKMNSYPHFADKFVFEPGRMLMMGYNKSISCRDGYHQETVTAQNGHRTVTVEKLGHDAELKHPYLVRYNESLYDFLVRVAHRCGEFLYFDDGHLCLGLPDDTIRAIVDSSAEVPPLSFAQCNYSALTDGEEDDTPEFASNYVDPADPIAQSSQSGHYDMEYSSDEFLHQITADDGFKSYLSGWVIGRKALTTLFTCDNFIKGMAMSVIMSIIELVNEKVLLPKVLDGELSRFAGDDVQDSTNLSKAETGVHNLQNSFYHLVEKLEKKSEKRKVTINFASRVPDLKLGDAVNPDDGLCRFYVVSRVYGLFTCENESVKSASTVEAVPVQKLEDFDKLQYVAVPPAGDIPMILKSSPKEAIVVRTDDPLRLGRVRVRYPWQHWDNPANVATTTTPLSPWIRVTVPYAGSENNLGGSMFTLDDGEHVMLDFVDGNMERPYVDGSMFFRYNKDGDICPHSPHRGAIPYSPKQQMAGYKARVLSSANGHSLTFTDGGDSSLLTSTVPLFDTLSAFFSIPHESDSHALDKIPFGVIKGGGVTLSDGSQLCSIEIKPGGRSVQINSKFGEVKINAFTGISVNAPNGDISIKGKNVRIEAGNNLTLKAGTNIKHPGGAPKRKGLKAGMILGTIAGKTMGKLVESKLGLSLEDMCDLSFIRSIIEIVMRPVEGTFTIKSERNIVAMAGIGKTAIPQSMLSGAGHLNVGGPGKMGFAGGYSHTENGAMQLSMIVIDSFFQNAEDSLTSLADGCSALLAHIDNSVLYLMKKRDLDSEMIFRNVTEKKDYQELFDMDEDDIRMNEKLLKKISGEYKKLLNKAKKIESDVFNLGSLQKLLDAKLNPLEVSVKVKEFPTGYHTAFEDDQWQTWAEMKSQFSGFAGRKKILKRSAVAQILLGSAKVGLAADSANRSALGTPANYVSDTGEKTYLTGGIGGLDDYILEKGGKKWTDVAAALVEPPKPDAVPQSGKVKLKNFGNGFLSSLTNYMGGGAGYDPATNEWTFLPSLREALNVNGESGPRAFSEVSANGNIMISNQQGSTLMLNDDMSTWTRHRNGNVQAIKDAVDSLNLN